MPWFLLAMAALTFGLYNVFVKLSAGHIHAVFGAFVLQAVAALCGLALVGWLRFATPEAMQVTSRGVWLAVLAGLAIGLAEVLTFLVYARGVGVAVGTPLIIGGSLLATTAIGVLLLREVLSPLQLVAIAMLASGLGLLAWDGARA